MARRAVPIGYVPMTTDERAARRAAIAAKMRELHSDAASAAARATDTTPQTDDDAMAELDELNVQESASKVTALPVTDRGIARARKWLAARIGRVDVVVTATPDQSAILLDLYASLVHLSKNDSEPARAMPPKGGWNNCIVKTADGGWTMTIARVSKRRD